MKPKFLYPLIGLSFCFLGFLGGWGLSTYSQSSHSEVLQAVKLSEALGVSARNVAKIDVGGEAAGCDFSKADGTWPQNVIEKESIAMGLSHRPTTLDGQLALLLELPVVEVIYDQEDGVRISTICGMKRLGCEVLYVDMNANISFESEKGAVLLTLPWNYHACQDGRCPDFVVLSATDTQGKMRAFATSWSQWQYHRLTYQVPGESNECEW